MKILDQEIEMDLTDTIQEIAKLQGTVNKFLLDMGFFSSKVSRWASEPGSPLSLEALLKHQAQRKNRFTPPSSPDKKRFTPSHHSPYSPIGPGHK